MNVTYKGDETASHLGRTAASARFLRCLKSIREIIEDFGSRLEPK